MKILSLLFLTLFLGKSCDGQKKQDLKTAVIEYVANTRGFYQKVIIQDQTIRVFKDRNGNVKPLATKISDADWKVLITEFGNINLEEIPNLKAPTQKRLYDGAAIANLTITYKGKTYKTNAFDHGFPPIEIEKLVNKINSIVKEEE
jgi:hypothetical protein